MTFKRLPFFTRLEINQLLDCCERDEHGCLIYRPAMRTNAPNTITLRGQRWCVTRVMWAETFGTTIEAMARLDCHEVIHIAECPNTGDLRDNILQPMCIEPSHLKLATHGGRVQVARERLAAYGGM